jgi:hypothetical protein
MRAQCLKETTCNNALSSFVSHFIASRPTRLVSGRGACEPPPHSLPLLKKLNELCQEPTPNHRDSDRCQTPIYRIIPDLIERRTRLLGDLIDRYCHVTTSPDYRSIMIRANTVLQCDSPTAQCFTQRNISCDSNVTQRWRAGWYGMPFDSR